MVRIKILLALSVAAVAAISQNEEDILDKRVDISWENIWNVKNGAVIGGVGGLCGGAAAIMAGYAALYSCTTTTTVISSRATVAATDNTTARYDHDMDFLTTMGRYGNWTAGVNSTLIIDSDKGSIAMTSMTSNGTHVTARASGYGTDTGTISRRSVTEMEFVYHATTTAGNSKCGSTAELAMYVTACKSALNTMSSNTRKTTCDRFSHGGTWRGHLVSAGVYSGYVYSIGKSCT